MQCPVVFISWDRITKMLELKTLPTLFNSKSLRYKFRYFLSLYEIVA